MKLQEIEKIIEENIGNHPYQTYCSILSHYDCDLTEIEFLAIACRFFNKNDSTRNLIQKWLDDMAYYTSPNSVGVCLIFGFRDEYYKESEYLVIINDSSLAFAKNTEEYLFYPNTHSEVWDIEASITKDDFENVPKGEIVYRKKDDTFVLYYDRCLSNSIQDIIDTYKERSLNLEIHINEEFDRLKYGE